MEQVYALGITCILYVQDRFSDSADYFHLVNEISNPSFILDALLPILSVLDSVFAAQFLLCMAFGSWMNCVTKWWFLEERPFWWVRETTFFAIGLRPKLKQTAQTCETGPGSPSGHSATAAMMILLILMWISHVMHDRKCYLWWWKVLLYPFLFGFLASVMLARMYVAAHFPHQVILGALVGALTTPALCLYISDPYIWTYGCGSRRELRAAWWRHIVLALSSIAIAGGTYGVLLLCGLDPMWTIKLAFRWCETPQNIVVTSTPLYTLVASTATLLGWGATVTPNVANYRHNTKNRSLLIAIFASAVNYHAFKYVNDVLIARDNAAKFYTWMFIINAIKPFMYLSVVPYLATWPYIGKVEREKAE